MNYELLDFTHKFILTNPELHEQASWISGKPIEGSGTILADQSICGTTACFAGWASLFAGFHHMRPHCEFGQEGCTCRDDYVVDETGRELSMMQAAEEALGLTPNQAYEMFVTADSREEITAIVNALHENPKADLDEVLTELYNRDKILK